MCCANAVCNELEGMDRQHICRSEQSAGSGFLQLAAFFGTAFRHLRGGRALRQVCTCVGNTVSQKKISRYCRRVQGLSANRIIRPSSMTKPSNNQMRGRGAVAGAQLQRAQRACERKGARLNTTGNGLSSELGTPSEPKKLTCDHLGPFKV